jgi:RNase adaptor protein for sRNA GlmZ degradation
MSSEKITEDIVSYRKNYYKKNKDIFNEIIICDICLEKYKKSSKSHHMNTKKHKFAVNEIENKKKLEEIKLKNENEINQIKLKNENLKNKLNEIIKELND